MSATNRHRADGPDTRREAGDFYPTPAFATRAILPHLPARACVLDPCAGTGSILAVAREAWPMATFEAFEAFELDEERARACNAMGVIARRGDRSWWCHPRDALAPEPWGGAWSVVLTNPPFSRAIEFVERALVEARPRGATVAMLLRLGFLESQARVAFHRAHPADVFVLPRRPSFTGKGTDASGYFWAVWGPGRGGRWSILDCEPAARGRKGSP